MRDDFPEEVRHVLANRANLVCSNPDCGSATRGPQNGPSKALNISVAAHRTAASLGGPRYEPILTPEQRRSGSNSVWLCQNCAKLVGNELSLYGTELLLKTRSCFEHGRKFVRTPLFIR